jgi:hypothetical protein
VTPSKVGGVVIAEPRHATRTVDIAKPDAGQRKREHCGRYAFRIHRIERFLGCPIQRRRRHLASVFCDISRRRKVMMDVYQGRFAGQRLAERR